MVRGDCAIGFVDTAFPKLTPRHFWCTTLSLGTSTAKRRRLGLYPQSFAKEGVT
jgi:hypothetical protein